MKHFFPLIIVLSIFMTPANAFADDLILAGDDRDEENIEKCKQKIQSLTGGDNFSNHPL